MIAATFFQVLVICDSQFCVQLAVL